MIVWQVIRRSHDDNEFVMFDTDSHNEALDECDYLESLDRDGRSTWFVQFIVTP